MLDIPVWQKVLIIVTYIGFYTIGYFRGRIDQKKEGL